MQALTSAHWRALVHGMVLGRLGYSPRGRQGELELAHLRGANRWLRQRNIVGVCIASKVKDGKLGALCLQVLVKKKHDKKKIPPERAVPEWIDARPALPNRRLVTDVRAVGAFSPDSFISGARPIKPGFAIGGESGQAGTIGCAVRDSAGRLLALTCAHVVSDNGNAASGARVFVPAEDQALDFGIAQPDFGTLVSSGTIDFGSNGAVSNLDAATVLPDDPSWLERRIADWDRVPAGVAATVQNHQDVFKVGAATQRTAGRVVGRHASITVPYVVGNTIRSATFLDQISISPFTDEGDSGSLVLTDDGRALGLHFASSQGMSICTPIQTVLTRLGVTLA